ncbi:MAG: U32 family peptidase [Treponema sp.]|jgi:putative protease|nr:U32 family peptidase [Treponema sp.]
MLNARIELLAPAGSPEALDAAIGEGADAVYLGLKNFNARMRSANFAYSQFEGALRTLRRMGKKIYVTVNTVFEQREADRMYQLLKYLAGLEPGGLIVQDFGVAAMARECFPSLKLHASTQMNIASARGANALSKYGVSRVVLARELALEELKEIRANTNMELEVFVHGALCVSASGICLFSSYLGGKSANRGMCTQACRRFYRNDDEGGYFFSPGDLQLLDRVPGLAAAGVNSFKIEGRMKSAEYVGTVVSAYRRVIDAVDEGGEEKIRKSIREGLEILRGDFARSKTVFYADWNAGAHTPAAPEQNQSLDWLDPSQDGGTGISLGTLIKVKGSGEGRRGLISAGQSGVSFALPAPGDSIRLHRFDDSDRKSHKLTAVEEFTGAGILHAWISIPEGFEPGDRVYLIQTRSMAKRYAPVIPRNIDGFKRRPGRDKAPVRELPPVRRGDSPFPEGLYTAVSRTSDLYIVQSSRPVRVILSYTRKTAAFLLGARKEPLPFKPGEIVLALDPYFPQAMERTLAGEIPALLEKGYRQFMVNNPGHCSLFRGSERNKPVLIAGPYLYIFNRWAEGFVASLGMEAFVSPLENNRQNLEKTVSRNRRSLAFITVFARPALFRIRADLSSRYQFKNFSDSRDERFTLLSDLDGSLVLPEKPFSIVDKIPFLTEAGFGRFILDLSGPPLKKADYRDLIQAVKKSAPVPGAGRFNWKDGFYQEEEKKAGAKREDGSV